MDLIKLENLSYMYAGATRAALNLEKLSLQSGLIHGLLGPNGSGKSTLFKVLSTQIVNFKGRVSVLGHDLMSGGGSEDVRAQLGVTFQNPSLDGILSVVENLRIQGALYGLRGAALEKRIDEVLEIFELMDRRHERTATLSGGLARRVELAKSMLHRPRLLLLDEPTTGVDPHLRLRFWQVLRNLVEHEQVSLIVSTHLMDEAELCDSIVIMNEGSLVDQGTPDMLKSRFGHDVVEIKIDEVSDRSELESVGKSLITLLPSGARVTAKDGHLRIEVTRGLTIMPMIESHFGSKLLSLRWGKPTLEDVFLAKTGKSLQS
ncbi:MAG TPA: ABC transporter ATP-binding protein [Bdellovibrionota bacterium]|nr:ABC transporter ATP-binding protein [Bdellovibrionota bacterium]